MTTAPATISSAIDHINLNGTVRVTHRHDGYGDDASECTMAEFLDANIDDVDTCADVLALLVGESCNLYGGGLVVVERLS